MAYEQRNLQGSLFKNGRKETDKHPDYNGSCMIGDVEYWISAWIKRPEGKDPFMSLAFKPKDNQAKPAAQTETNYTPTFSGDSVPF